jgi:DNA replication protein DnaC
MEGARCKTEWVVRLGGAQRQGRLADELHRLVPIPVLVVDEVGYMPFDLRRPTSCFRSSPPAVNGQA